MNSKGSRQTPRRYAVYITRAVHIMVHPDAGLDEQAIRDMALAAAAGETIDALETVVFEPEVEEVAEL